MKITAVVPMKLNNRRLPQKNTKCFTNGRPLCHYILSTLLTVDGIDEVYVYCSNPDIQGFIPDGVKYLRRSSSLDEDTTKMNEVLQAFLLQVPADIYVMTHATSPFVSKTSIIFAETSGKSKLDDCLVSACSNLYSSLIFCFCNVFKKNINHGS